MNRMDVENILLEICIPANVKGFRYITDSIEYIEKNGEDILVTKELYPDIAKKHETTPSRVERAIRHAFEIARSKGELDIVEKYIGFSNCSNHSSLARLHKKIKQDCKVKQWIEEPNNTKAEKANSEGTELDIGKIIQELGRILNELKGVLNEFARTRN